MHSLHPKLFLMAAHATGLTVLAFALLLFYLLVHRPLVQQQETDTRACTALKQGLQDSLEVRRDHLQLTRQLEELNEQVADARKRVPAASAESRFLAHATGAAEVARVDLRDYRRDGVTVEDGHGEVRVALRGTGSHAAVCRFLEKLSRFDNAAVLTELEISSASSTNSYPFQATYSLYHDVAAPSGSSARAWPTTPDRTPGVRR